MHEVIGGKQLAVLQVIYRLAGTAYGVSISEKLEEDGEPTALPQIYLILEKLLQKGFLTAEMGEPTEERGGRRKRLYRITGQGREVLSSSLVKNPRLATRGGWVVANDVVARD
jgi:DNA-binding PadR family transcriptional regulator